MSSIKLTADSGGGTFEIKAPSSSGNTRVLTLPDTGNLTLNGGKVLQVISSTKQDAWSYTANTTAAVDVTGTDQDGNGSVFCVKITPSTTSSKILFTCNFMLGMGGGAAYVQGFMKRGTTTLLPGTHGTGNMVNCTFGRSGTGSSYYVENVGFTLLDSPGVNTELTYKVQLGKGDGSYEVYVNRPATLDNQPYNTLGSSTLTVMEISG
jgi:hypothetical protein